MTWERELEGNGEVSTSYAKIKGTSHNDEAGFPRAWYADHIGEKIRVLGGRFNDGLDGGEPLLVVSGPGKGRSIARQDVEILRRDTQPFPIASREVGRILDKRDEAYTRAMQDAQANSEWEEPPFDLQEFFNSRNPYY